jgi:hypothetical protein
VLIVFFWKLIRSHTNGALAASWSVFGLWIFVEILVSMLKFNETIEQFGTLGIGMGMLRLVGLISLFIGIGALVGKFGSGANSAGTNGGGSGGGGPTQNSNETLRNVFRGGKKIKDWAGTKLAQRGVQNAHKKLQEIRNTIERREGLLLQRENAGWKEVREHLQALFKLYANAMDAENKLVKYYDRIKAGEQGDIVANYRSEHAHFDQIRTKLIEEINWVKERIAQLIQDAQDHIQLLREDDGSDKNVTNDLTTTIQNGRNRVRQLRSTNPDSSTALAQEINNAEKMCEDISKLQRSIRQSETLLANTNDQAEQLIRGLEQLEETYRDQTHDLQHLQSKRVPIMNSIRSIFVRIAEEINQVDKSWQNIEGIRNKLEGLDQRNQRLGAAINNATPGGTTTS